MAAWSWLDLLGENLHADLGTQGAEPARSGDDGSFVLVAHIGLPLTTVATYLQSWQLA